jgi:hypothetical protein
MLTAFSVGCEKAPQVSKEVQVLEAAVRILSARVDDLSAKVILADAERERYQDARLTLTSRGFSRVDTSTGFFLVSVVNAQPYVNGYKVSLNVGNPLAADYDNVTMTFKWGRKWDQKQDYGEWEKGLKTKAERILTQLKGGTWNRVEVVLAPATTEEVAFLSLSLEAPTISLMTR